MIFFVTLKFLVVFILAGRVVSAITPPSFQIHPNGNKNKCLDVRGGVFADNTPVDIYDCNGTRAQDWWIFNGSTKVRLAGTNFCLDAGTYPSNNTPMKIYTCYDNLKAQQWYYTNDKRIALEGQGFCLDLTNGNLKNFSVTQIYKCTDYNTNQVWTT